MPFVVDASVTCAWAFGDEATDALDDVLDQAATGEVYAPPATDILDLCGRHDLSAFDALYLALRMKLPLATLDAQLATAARREGLAVLGH
jgi:predicted nucleic acid-binding protein